MSSHAACTIGWGLCWGLRTWGEGEGFQGRGGGVLGRVWHWGKGAFWIRFPLQRAPIITVHVYSPHNTFPSLVLLLLLFPLLQPPPPTPSSPLGFPTSFSPGSKKLKKGKRKE